MKKASEVVDFSAYSFEIALAILTKLTMVIVLTSLSNVRGRMLMSDVNTIDE